MAESVGEEYTLDVNKHARYFQMVLNGIPSKGQDMQRAMIAFFCLCGLDILGQLQRIDPIKPQIVAWLKLTQKKQDDFGFRGGTTFTHGGDLDTPHITMTSVSLLSLVILGEKIDEDAATLHLTELANGLNRFQIENGCFQATLLPDDEFDVRFIYSAACIHAVLKMVGNSSSFDLDKINRFIEACFTYDGALTVKPDLEGHAGAVYCALASLKLTGQLDVVVTPERRFALINWLLMRQNADGGFNGRPNKPSDSCYFFWVGASLAILDAVNFVEPKSVIQFCRSVEDRVIGGFGKLPGCVADPLHAYLTLAGLSLFGTFKDILHPVNAALCCPDRVNKKMSGVTSASMYGRRMVRLAGRIFGEVVRPTTTNGMAVVDKYAQPAPCYKPNIVNYYPDHPNIARLFFLMRQFGLYRDEHLDFKEEMERLRRLRGKVKPVKGQGRRAQVAAKKK